MFRSSPDNFAHMCSSFGTLHLVHNILLAYAIDLLSMLLLLQIQNNTTATLQQPTLLGAPGTLSKILLDILFILPKVLF